MKQKEKRKATKLDGEKEEKLKLCACMHVCMHIYVLFFRSPAYNLHTKTAGNLSFFPAQFSRVKPSKRKSREYNKEIICV